MLTKKQINDSFLKSLMIAKAVYGNKVPNMTLEINTRFGYRTLGRCTHSNPPLIEINPKIPLEQLDKTMVHEIAHAICGPRVGHSQQWYSVANRMGELLGLTITRTSSVAWDNNEALYTITCSGCGNQWPVLKPNKVTKNPQLYRCRCGAELVVKRNR